MIDIDKKFFFVFTRLMAIAPYTARNVHTRSDQMKVRVAGIPETFSTTRYETSFPWNTVRPTGYAYKIGGRWVTPQKPRIEWVHLPKPNFFGRVCGTRWATGLLAWLELIDSTRENLEQGNCFTTIFDQAILAGQQNDSSLMPRGWSSIPHTDLFEECARIHHIHEEVFHAILLKFFSFGLSRRT